LLSLVQALAGTNPCVPSSGYIKLALPLDIMMMSSVDERAPKLELVAVHKRTRGIIPHSDYRYSTATILIAAF
jgi:hypothetical protein